MRMFCVKAGTPAKVIKDGDDWMAPNIKDHVTKKDNGFFREDIILDPVGKLGCQQNDRIIGGAYERAGCYGFLRDGWILIVNGAHVEVL